MERDPSRFTAVRCDRTRGSFSWHLFLLPPFATSSPPHPHSTRTHLTLKKKITWLCPAGLPVAAGIASGARQTRRALCAHGHGPRHCLQQCAGLRPQHRRWHGSERHHYCKWWRRRPRARGGSDLRDTLDGNDKEWHTHAQTSRIGVSWVSDFRPLDIYNFFFCHVGLDSLFSPEKWNRKCP